MKLQLTILLVLSLMLTGITSPLIVPLKPESHKPTITKQVLRRCYLKHRTTENVPTICNNPGNFRPTNPKLNAIAIGFYRTEGNGDFLVFDTPCDGFLALRIWIRDRYGWTIEKAIYKFATPNQNNTEKYIRDLCHDLHCSRYDVLCYENEMALMGAIAKIEGFKG